MRRFLHIIFTVLILVPAKTQNPCVTGDSLYHAQNYVEAAFFLKQCHQQDTAATDQKLILANCMMAMGDWSEAKRFFHDIEKINPELVNAALAFIYDTELNIPKAIKYYTALSETFPGNGQYFRKIGELYLQSQNPLEATIAFQKAIKISNNDISAWQGLGDAMTMLGEHSFADTAYSSAMMLDSQRVSVLFSYAKLTYKTKEYGRVIDLLVKAEQLIDLPVYYQNILAFSFIQQGDPEKALWYLQRLLALDPEHETNLFYAGMAHELAGRYEEALTFYQLAARAGISKSMFDYHSGEARACMHLKKYKSAIQAYENSLMYKQTSQPYFYMGNAAEQVFPDGKKALMYYKKFLKNNPEDEAMISTAKARIGILTEYRFMQHK